MNYQYRYDRGCRELVDAARAGELGDILYGTCTHPLAPRGRATSRAPGARAASARAAARSSRRAATRWTSCSRPRAVGRCGRGARSRAAGSPTSRSRTSPWAAWRPTPGCLLSVTSSAVATPERAVTIEVYGSRATAVWTGPVAAAPAGVREAGRGAARRRGSPALPVRGVHPAARSLEAFRRWVVDGEKPLHDAESTLPVLAAVTTIYASAREGRRIDVPPLPTEESEMKQPANAAAPGRLGLGTKIGYGVGDIFGGGALLIIGTYYMYFLTDMVKHRPRPRGHGLPGEQALGRGDRPVRGRAHRPHAHPLRPAPAVSCSRASRSSSCRSS